MMVGLFWAIGAIGFLLVGVGLGMTLEASRWRSNAHRGSFLESDGRFFVVRERGRAEGMQ